MEAQAASVSQIMQIITSLLLVVGIIFAGAWFFRRYGRLHGMLNDDMKVVAGISVGQREKVIILQAGETQIMLGVSPGRIQALHVFDEPVIERAKEGEAEDAGESGFSACLKKEIKNKIRP